MLFSSALGYAKHGQGTAELKLGPLTKPGSGAGSQDLTRVAVPGRGYEPGRRVSSALTPIRGLELPLQATGLLGAGVVSVGRSESTKRKSLPTFR